MATTVSLGGQVSLPVVIRDVLRLRPGDAGSFDPDSDGRVVLRKAGTPANAEAPERRFAALRGSATAGLTTEEIMAMTRGDER